MEKIFKPKSATGILKGATHEDNMAVIKFNMSNKWQKQVKSSLRDGKMILTVLCS